MNPQLSIIIVNYQNWPLLGQCLYALANLDWIEVVVVDNQSPDDRMNEYAELFPAFHFYKNSGNNGFANACNLGASKASSELFFFLNPDAIAGEDLLKRLISKYWSITDLAILGVIQVNDSGKIQAYEKPFPNFSTILGWSRAIVQKMKFSLKSLLAEDVQQVPWVSGAAVCISRAWYNKIGGWDESFWMYFEDTALSKSATDSGGKVGILLSPRLIHSHGGSSRINATTTALTKLEVMISRHVYISKYVDRVQRFPTQLLAIVNHLIVAFIQLLVGVILCWKPKGRAYVIQFKNLLAYYVKAIKNKSWLSPRTNKV